jgi:nicotinamidase-related amidase
MLRVRAVENIVLSGHHHRCQRAHHHAGANDRGFEGLLLEDCCGATDRSNHDHAIKMVKMQVGVFGAVSDSAAFIGAIA